MTDKAALARLDVVLLGLLATGERTGYDVWKWFEGRGSFVGYSAATSQIYRQLGRFVERGWAAPTAAAARSGPDTKLYRITDAGRERLDEWVSSPYVPSRRPLDPDFQVRLRFAGSRSPEKALELVRTELAFRRQAEENMDRSFDELLVSSDAGPAERRWSGEWYLMQGERGHYMVSSLIAWLEATERRLAAMVGRG